MRPIGGPHNNVSCSYSYNIAVLPCYVSVRFEILCIGTTPEQTIPCIDRSRPDFVQLRSESVRLSTFHDWPSSAGRIVDPRDLAATGLFYTGHADRVQCAFCRGCLRSWKPGDRPAEEHRRHFPDCPLMRGAAADADSRASLTTISASSTFTSSSSTRV